MNVTERFKKEIELTKGLESLPYDRCWFMSREDAEELLVLIEASERQREALIEISKRNRLRNNLDCYLQGVAAHGLGKGVKPSPEEFGLKKETDNASKIQ